MTRRTAWPLPLALSDLLSLAQVDAVIMGEADAEKAALFERLTPAERRSAVRALVASWNLKPPSNQAEAQALLREVADRIACLQNPPKQG